MQDNAFHRREFLITVPAIAAAAALPNFVNPNWTRAGEDYGPANADITLIVMDPLAAPLACDCVEGYAQRKYEVLADYLAKETKKTVRVKWTDDLESLTKEGAVSPSIIIGKDSVVRFGAHKLSRVVSPVAMLSDQQGNTTQKGMFVVRSKNKASSILDLDGFDIFFGPESCDEKYLAPIAKLKEADVSFQIAEICDACSVAAKKLLEISDDTKQAAVISSYAEPLLLGCGNIKQGDLRVVASSEEIPFVSAFLDSSVPKDLRSAIKIALLKTRSNADVVASLQSKSGFVPYDMT
ncbi:MAG: phosphate/phosphite/phosphonate ABC transporter substrate-binding protein [Pirellula sp.]|jgi:ABC-type phosphate/phosphonate transport system substrate-binding protein|nr:phosphate/phosphite/phosphonate ABC transporter substrate-binding protein [Pirellula sp.]